MTPRNTPHDPDPNVDGPAMGDHPELETDQTQRRAPTQPRGRSLSIVVAGLVALAILVIIVILLVI